MTRNKNIYQYQPEHIASELTRGPEIRPQGVFWEAYNAMLCDDDFAALCIFEDDYFNRGWLNRESQRVERIRSLNRFGHLPLEGLDWVEFMAAANSQDTLFHMHRNGIVKAIHIVHAAIEFGRDLLSGPLIRPTVEESVALLELYDLELELLSGSLEIDNKVRGWLDDRQHRAEAHFRKIQEFDDAA